MERIHVDEVDNSPLSNRRIQRNIYDQTINDSA